MRLLYNPALWLCNWIVCKPLRFRFMNSGLGQLSHFRQEINILFFWVTILEQILRKESWKKKSSIPKSSEPSTNSKAQKKSPRFGKKLVFFPTFPSSFTYLIILISLTSSLIQLSRTCPNRLFIDFASIQYQPIGIPRISIWVQLLCESIQRLGVRIFRVFIFVSISLIGYLIALSFCVNFQLY